MIDLFNTLGLRGQALRVLPSLRASASWRIAWQSISLSKSGHKKSPHGGAFRIEIGKGPAPMRCQAPWEYQATFAEPPERFLGVHRQSPGKKWEPAGLPNWSVPRPDSFAGHSSRKHHIHETRSPRPHFFLLNKMCTSVRELTPGLQ